MSDRTAKAITAVTVAVTVVVGVLTFRTVTQKQLSAMEQCAPNCQLGAPFMTLGELVPIVVLVAIAALIISPVRRIPEDERDE